MFLAVLIIAVALGAEPELKIGTVHLCPAADCAFMLGDARVSPYIPLKLMPSAEPVPPGKSPQRQGRSTY